MITIDLEKCSGCRRCEVNCSFFHSGKVGRSGARIKVVKIEGLGIDFPVVCQQCRERYCMECPESALQSGSMGEVVLTADACTACGTCETLCPIGAIELFEDLPYVCDLCGGDPRCVKSCTMGAISFDVEIVEHVSLEPHSEGSHRLSLEEKRVRFARSSSQELRDLWISLRRE